MKLRIQTVGFKQQFPVSQGTRTGLNRGILLGCGYAENGAVYLLGCEPSPYSCGFGVGRRSNVGRYWGDNKAYQCSYANGADLSAKVHGVTAAGFATCDDKYPTRPVGSFQANKFGLYDMAGNVGEWVEDCYNDTYRDVPNDGSAVETCIPKFHNARVMRGGGWNAIPAWMSSASRDVEVPSLRADTFGFRVARAD